MRSVKMLPDKHIRVGKIICVGRNYAAHIKEMDSQETAEPVLFLKPSTAILNPGELIRLPSFSSEIHHEIELALLVGKKAQNIRLQDWHFYIQGVGIALDLTLRDIQKIAKQKGLPWSVAKGFDGACPVSDFVQMNTVDNINNLEIKLIVNNDTRQSGNTGMMIFKPDRLVSYISQIFTLEPGDLILTGTPAGVGPLQSGDIVEASIEKIGKVTYKVA